MVTPIYGSRQCLAAAKRVFSLPSIQCWARLGEDKGSKIEGHSASRIYEETMAKAQEICKGRNSLWSWLSWDTHTPLWWGNHMMAFSNCTCWTVPDTASKKFVSFCTGKTYTICGGHSWTTTTPIWAEPVLRVNSTWHSIAAKSQFECLHTCLYTWNVFSSWRGWIWSS